MDNKDYYVGGKDTVDRNIQVNLSGFSKNSIEKEELCVYNPNGELVAMCRTKEHAKNACLGLNSFELLKDSMSLIEDMLGDRKNPGIKDLLEMLERENVE